MTTDFTDAIRSEFEADYPALARLFGMDNLCAAAATWQSLLRDDRGVLRETQRGRSRGFHNCLLHRMLDSDSVKGRVAAEFLRVLNKGLEAAASVGGHRQYRTRLEKEDAFMDILCELHAAAAAGAAGLLREMHVSPTGTTRDADLALGSEGEERVLADVKHRTESDLGQARGPAGPSLEDQLGTIDRTTFLMLRANDLRSADSQRTLDLTRSALVLADTWEQGELSTEFKVVDGDFGAGLEGADSEQVGAAWEYHLDALRTWWSRHDRILVIEKPSESGIGNILTVIFPAEEPVRELRMTQRNQAQGGLCVLGATEDQPLTTAGYDEMREAGQGTVRFKPETWSVKRLVEDVPEKMAGESFTVLCYVDSRGLLEEASWSFIGEPTVDGAEDMRTMHGVYADEDWRLCRGVYLVTLPGQAGGVTCKWLANDTAGEGNEWEWARELEVELGRV